jgi:tetratricopeptide (TPR) repeat protein
MDLWRNAFQEMTMRFALLFASLFAGILLLSGCGSAPEAPPEAKDSSPVIFKSSEGKTITQAQLAKISGPFNYESIGKNDLPAEAVEKHNEALKLMDEEEYKKALPLLEQVAELAHEWPQPVYEIADVYVQLKDPDNATRYYRQTIELVPRGYKNAITALDALEREHKGTLPAGTYLAFVALDSEGNPEKRAEAVREFVKTQPQFAPGWLELAYVAKDDTERLAAIEKGLDADPDAETKGQLQIAKALVLDKQGEHDAAIRLLGDLALDSRSTLGTEHEAKVALAAISKK